MYLPQQPAHSLHTIQVALHWSVDRAGNTRIIAADQNFCCCFYLFIISAAHGGDQIFKRHGDSSLVNGGRRNDVCSSTDAEAVEMIAVKEHAAWCFNKRHPLTLSRNY